MRRGKKRSRRKIRWPITGTAREKAALIQRVLEVNPTATSYEVHRHFRGITREGIVTHCWRYGPKLARAKSGPKKALPRA